MNTSDGAADAKDSSDFGRDDGMLLRNFEGVVIGRAKADGFGFGLGSTAVRDPSTLSKP